MSAFQSSKIEKGRESDGAPIGCLVLMDREGKIEVMEYWPALTGSQARESGRELIRIGERLAKAPGS